MRFSYLRTLLLLLPALLLLNSACQRTATNDTVAKNMQHVTTINPDDEKADEATLDADSAYAITQEPEVSNPAHLSLAASYVGTTELTGENDGPEIERFLASVGLPAGNPYCAAFISFILEETPAVQEPTVRSGLASHFITDNSIDAKQVLRGAEEIGPGTIVIWRKGNTIYGHAAFVEKQSAANEFATIEANTSDGVYGNQSDGDGVWRRSRSIQPGNYFRITNFTRVIYNS